MNLVKQTTEGKGNEEKGGGVKYSGGGEGEDAGHDVTEWMKNCGQMLYAKLIHESTKLRFLQKINYSTVT